MQAGILRHADEAVRIEIEEGRVGTCRAICRGTGGTVACVAYRNGRMITGGHIPQTPISL